MMSRRAGFTIVELLIVIVVIAVLATISITTYIGIQERAQYSRTRDAIAKTEKAFTLAMIYTGRTSWPTNTELAGCTGVPDNQLIALIIENCPEIGLVQFLNSSSYRSYGVPLAYDNDGDTYVDQCPGGYPANPTFTHGVNLFMGSAFSQTLMVKLETDIDKDDGLGCGRVRESSPTGQKYFMLSAEQAFDD